MLLYFCIILYLLFLFNPGLPGPVQGAIWALKWSWGQGKIIWALGIVFDFFFTGCRHLVAWKETNQVGMLDSQFVEIAI